MVAIKVLVQEDERSAEDRIAEIAGLLGDVTDKPPASHAASVREALTDDHLRMRNLLASLREPEFAGRDAKPSLRQLELIGTLYDSGTTEVPPDCDVPVSVGWRDLVNGDDRARALRVLEASAITGLRKGRSPEVGEYLANQDVHCARCGWATGIDTTASGNAAAARRLTGDVRKGRSSASGVLPDLATVAIPLHYGNPTKPVGTIETATNSRDRAKITGRTERVARLCTLLVERLRLQRASLSTAVTEARVPPQSELDTDLQRGSPSSVTVDFSTDSGRSKPFHG